MEGEYYVQVEDVNGCTNVSKAAFVNLIPKTELFIPTAFTPNGDEHNDLLVIKGKFIQSFQMDIVNRWGEVVFETDYINKFWDGTFEELKVIEGTYYYNIQIVGEDNKIFIKQGTVEVIY